MSKKSKHPTYDDPSAFRQQFPRINEVTSGDWISPVSRLGTVKYFAMGKCKVVLREADETQGWFMAVRRNDRYASWDEMVWLRYNLIPDAAIMSLLLPNLNSYINMEDNEYKFVFTMEQKLWALDPRPRCCGFDMNLDETNQSWVTATFTCSRCGKSQIVDCNTWNEQHSNGLKGIENANG